MQFRIVWGLSWLGGKSFVLATTGFRISCFKICFQFSTWQLSLSVSSSGHSWFFPRLCIAKNGKDSNYKHKTDNKVSHNLFGCAIIVSYNKTKHLQYDQGARWELFFLKKCEKICLEVEVLEHVLFKKLRNFFWKYFFFYFILLPNC